MGVLALTFSPLFVRWAGAPGVVTSFYRMLITAIILTPFAARRIAHLRRPALRNLAFPVAAGLFTSFDHAFWSAGIERTTVANATLLNYIAPLWVSLFAWTIWRERLDRRYWLGLGLTFAGAFGVLGNTLLIRPAFAFGDLLAIISSVFFAGFFLAAQIGRQHMDTLTFLWTTITASAISLGLISRVLGVELVGYSRTAYVTFLLAALISQLGGYYFLTFALGKLPVSVITPTTVAQPVLTALLAVPLAGEAIMLGQAIAGGVTLGGIYLVNTAQRRITTAARKSLLPDRSRGK